jgi:hypothetical protein
MKLKYWHGTAPNLNREEVVEYLHNAINNEELEAKIKHKNIQSVSKESSFTNQQKLSNEIFCKQCEPKKQFLKDPLSRIKLSELSSISIEYFNQNITRAFTFSYFILLTTQSRKKALNK